MRVSEDLVRVSEDLVRVSGDLAGGAVGLCRLFLSPPFTPSKESKCKHSSFESFDNTVLEPFKLKAFSSNQYTPDERQANSAHF